MGELKVSLRGIKAYSFTDEKSGRLVEGVNVFFENVLPESTDITKGFVPAKVTMPIESLKFFQGINYPCDAYPVIEQRLTNKGVFSKIVDFKVIK